jgi:hypothetical protein
MAKIVEELLVFKVSSIVKDDADVDPSFSDEIVENLEAIISELVGAGRVVEVLKD